MFKNGLNKGTTTVALIAGIAIVGCGTAIACSRVLWSDGKAVVVGRSMDWVLPMPVDFYVLPRGIKQNGMTGKNTLSWTSKFGSVVNVARHGGASDGMNEKGLAGHMLWLAESDYGKFDLDRPSLSVGLWLQFYLDNFATVDEAIAFMEKTPFEIATGSFDGKKVTVHMAMEDATGDSAIIQYIGGKPKIYHGREYTVMTNSPPYDVQLQTMKIMSGLVATSRCRAPRKPPTGSFARRITSSVCRSQRTIASASLPC